MARAQDNGMTLFDRKRDFALIGSVFLVALALEGCGSSSLVPVSGTVRRDGQIVSNGRVTFVPIGGGNPASGLIQADGTFQLATKETTGATSGAYYVVVSSECAMEPNGRRVLYIGPRNKPIEVTVEKETPVAIEISPDDGWRIVVDD